MFGEHFDLAILSGPLALHRAKHWAKWFWWSGYAIVGVCGAGSARLPPAPAGCFVFASPNYRAARHRGIGIAQSLNQHLEFSLPRVFPKPAGVDDGRPFA
ncbi:MAG: hypothetical protein GDA36_04000 [Rhodobacteraceae bacterium]|nr:hypothetical protein [Paracoccaceae bacterium]